MTVDLVRSQVDADGLLDPAEVKLNENVTTILSLFVPETEYFDEFDEQSKRLYSRAVKKLGLPGKGQAVGFVPALLLGGAPDISTVKIVPALEHFSILAQLQQFSLYSYLTNPSGVVRLIG